MLRHWQPWVIVAIAGADLATTVWLLKYKDAAEANRFMALFLAQGLWFFVAAKVVLTAGPVALLEWARRHRPAFVYRAANAAIVGYVLLYLVGVARANLVPHPSQIRADDPVRAALWVQCEQRIRERRTRQAFFGVPPRPAEHGERYLLHGSRHRACAIVKPI